MALQREVGRRRISTVAAAEDGDLHDWSLHLSYFRSRYFQNQLGKTPLLMTSLPHRTHRA
jgi:hypothetical protein